jgi:hypothetical protein
LDTLEHRDENAPLPLSIVQDGIDVLDFFLLEHDRNLLSLLAEKTIIPSGAERNRIDFLDKKAEL